MKAYTQQDTNPMSYQEFGEVTSRLISKLESYSFNKDIKFDVVAPLLRSGGVPGSIIAIHFEIINILPIQFKYFYNPTRLVQILDFPTSLVDIPEIPNILITETNTVSGDTVKAAVNLIKEHFPKAKLYYATVAKAFDGPAKFEGIEECFYGTMTDEMCTATEEEAQKLGLRKRITIFPWEIAKNELNDINAAIN